MALFIVVVVINKFVLLLLFFLKVFVVLSPFFAFFAISIIYTVTHDDYDIMCSPANRISYIITFYSCIILLKADEWRRFAPRNEMILVLNAPHLIKTNDNVPRNNLDCFNLILVTFI